MLWMTYNRPSKPQLTSWCSAYAFFPKTKGKFSNTCAVLCLRTPDTKSWNTALKLYLWRFLTKARIYPQICSKKKKQHQIVYGITEKINFSRYQRLNWWAEHDLSQIHTTCLFLAATSNCSNCQVMQQLETVMTLIHVGMENEKNFIWQSFNDSFFWKFQCI